MLEQDPVIPQSSLPFQSTAAALVLEREMCVHTLGKYLGVDQGTSIDEVGIGAVPDQDTPAAMAVCKWTVAVGILIGAEKRQNVGADKVEKLTVASGRVEDAVATSMGSSVHQGRLGSVGKAVWMIVGAAGVGYNWTHS